MKAMAVSKNKRKYFFQIIAFAHLASTTPATGVSDLESKTAGTLAFRFISTAAKHVTADEGFHSTFKSLSLSGKQTMLSGQSSKTIDASSKALQTSRDLQFLIYIFKSQNQKEAALSVLKDEARTGSTSAIAAASWDLMTEKVTLLENCKKWEELWSTCRALLLDAQMDLVGDDGPPTYSFGKIGDDYRIWRGMVIAAANIGTEEVRSQTLDILANLTILGTRSRLLARLEFDLHPSNHSDEKSQILSTLLEYHSEDHTSPSSFRNLTYFMPRISPKDKLLLMEDARKRAGEASRSVKAETEISTINWIRSEIHSLKLDYHLKHSKKGPVLDISEFESFVARCISTHGSSLTVDRDLPVTVRRCGDDAAILAAMACVRLHNTGRNHALLQCIVILENLLTHSPHNYDAIVLLTRVYIRLGAVSKAFELYERLDVKNIQTQTLSWMILSRISTIHPHASKRFRCDPLSLITSYLKWVDEKMEAKLTSARKDLAGEDAMSLCQVTSLVHMLLVSHSRLALQVNRGWIKWWQRDPVSLAPADIYMVQEHDWADVRDLAATPNYEHYDEYTMDQYVRPGPLPDNDWVKLQMALNEMRISLRKCSKFSNFACVTAEVSYLSAFNQEFAKTRTDNQSIPSLTDREWKLCCEATLVYDALKSMSCAYDNGLAPSRSPQEPSQGVELFSEAKRAIEKAFRHHKEAVYGLDITYWQGVAKNPKWHFDEQGWRFFHQFYTQIELLHTYWGFVQVVALFCKEVNNSAVSLPSDSEYGDFTTLKDPQGWLEKEEGRKNQWVVVMTDLEKAVQKLQGNYRLNDTLKDMTNLVLCKGPNADEESTNFKTLMNTFDEDEVRQRCRDIVDSFIDGLDGMIGVNSTQDQYDRP